jgi:hypothetical protein
MPGRFTWIRGILCVILLIGGAGLARAAGVLAVGECGAYGFAYDYAVEAAASQAALAKCAGGCKVVPINRACGAIAIDGRNACRARLCGRRAAWGGTKLGAAPVLRTRRQGVRHSRLCLRREGLTSPLPSLVGYCSGHSDA